ncbi:tetratricopeptide repeat-containing sulfotransferase family protein [Shimia haliotis]|uniref:TPR repeat-containing protein n=1 Tax=Shimia haliotis TaxID=1280847 RepID=A0A1I4B3V6_9RHOB|nr:sulfotransferase [Shimia haliotis]SFK63538.1 TPR repeat-containing protein [Shimia haliotis]
MAPNKIKVADVLRQAHKAEKSGNSGEALALFNQVLEAFPNNPKAKAGQKRLAGQAQSGGFLDGVDWSALDNSAVGQLNLSGVADPLGLQTTPQKTAERGDPFSGLSDLRGRGDPEEAAALWRQGNAAFAKKDFLAAALLFRDAVAKVSERADYWNDLGLALQKLERHQASLIAFQRAFTGADSPAMVYANLATAHAALGDREEAAAFFEDGLRVHPDSADLVSALAVFELSTGRKSDGEKSLRRLVGIAPDNGNAWLQLGLVSKNEQAARDLEALDRALQAKGLNPENRGAALLGRGHLLAATQDYDAAFASFDEGNRILSEMRPFDFQSDVAEMDRTKRLFSEGKVEKLVLPEVVGSASIPIFIVGMPRSGSTLIEQILSSHSKVFGAGEAPWWTSIMREEAGSLDAAEAVTKDQLRGMRSAYLAEMTRIAGGAPFFTDKCLPNFKHIGFIAHAFPEAKIIHMNRDPMAVCWSMFRRNFVGNDFTYSNNLDDLARYYRLYRDMMAFWKGRFGDRIMDISYEAFTESPESGTRELLAKCGLQFEENTLKFYESKRAAKTASMTQVREQVYQGSSDEWRKYAQGLAGLQRALADV